MSEGIQEKLSLKLTKTRTFGNGKRTVVLRTIDVVDEYGFFPLSFPADML